MANVLINDEYLENIADAIREKSGSVLTYKPKEMANAIAAIPTGGSGEIDNFSEQLLKRTPIEGAIAINVDWVGPYGLAGLNNVTSITCSARVVQKAGCYGNENLTTVNFPEVMYLRNSAFAYNRKLTAVSIPKVQEIDSYAFNECDKLEKLDLGSNLMSLSGEIIKNSGVSAVIIRTDYVPDCIEDVNPFPRNFQTDIYTTTGYIYVPRAMMAAYQGYEGQPGYGRYDYWSMQNYRAIEDYPEICG